MIIQYFTNLTISSNPKISQIQNITDFGKTGNYFESFKDSRVEWT